MTAPARLLALRLHGFKSFAERTTVEFGPGISAVVGPNGSGKSNLADALRWALGEQGRSLRMRRAEDVIWAGSERRSAQGMADVTLVLDNSDGLLPVDFSVVELGRRLYRSGENDYLLNRQRVRLKDLVDLLDTAHLADNAFLFIGQGMVDQALALRPEERRPLFEEVAGVRRHERRRKRSEEQLAESLANLARLEDILAELRPQARRLASQAELQVSRQSAGHELVAALLLSAHARWHEAASRVAAAGSVRSRTRHDADLAMSELTTAEELAADITRQLAARASEERVRRRAHEAAGTVHNAIGLRHERLAAERDGLARDRARLATERDAVTGALDAQRRTLRIPEPAWDLDLESSLGEAERSLAEAQRELATLLAADRARGEQLAALGRAEAARGAELELARRRQAEADRRAGAERALETAAAEQLPALEAALGGARAALAASIETERLAVVARELARQEGEATEAARAAAGERAQAEVGALAARRSRLDALAARLTEEEGRGIAHAARRRGGRRLDADLVVDPALRGAVQSALAEAARAYLVTRDAVMPLGAERGILMVADDSGASRPDRAREVAERRIRDLALAMGGGVLDAAIRRDSVGGATRILARAIWLPSLADCIELQRELPPGWLAVPRNGGALVTDLTVALGVTDGTLERRAEMHALGAEVARLEHEAASAQERAAAATAGAATARANLDRARATESASSATRRRAEEAERLAARRLEATAREHAWHRSQADRLAAQTALQAAVETLQAASGAAGAGGAGQNAAAEGSEAEPGGGASARSTWQRRVADVRARRDRLAEQAAIGDLALREADARRARAEATLAARAERLTVIDRELQALADGERELTQAREQLSHEAAEASVAEAAAREGLDRLLAADGTDRDRLAGAEQIVATVRERLRIIVEQSRAADHASLAADLGLEALREQLLVDLASLGDAALRELPVAGPSPATGAASQQSLSGDGFPVAGAEVAAAIVSELVPDDERGRMEQHLAAATARWSSEQPATEAPSAARLGSLRRRFSDLGAANPFAVEEYEALRARLADLETQRADLGRAIERTRQLIEELAGLIALQFRATFRALETAFDQRFQQLFGGGFARLELTDPDDLGATGVEITARPPGKRKQPLSMLSGGERSLTAVALLLAMLQVRPVPFCVLDEVDAALDEANVGRFTAALRDLAAATQFIIITHNRGTIRAADALYGVTVGDDSVSRVISLRLDDARALAGTRRASGADAVVASDPAVDVAAG